MREVIAWSDSRVTGSGQVEGPRFTLDPVVTGPGRLANSRGDNDPSGQYLAIDMTVENIGAEEERMPSPGQSPLGSSGTEHRLAACRWQRLRPARPAITLPPGESGEMTIVYDVPVDTEPDHMLIRGRTVLNDPVRLGPR